MKKGEGVLQSVYFPLPAVCAQHSADYDKCSNDFAHLQRAFVNDPVEQVWESASERILKYYRIAISHCFLYLTLYIYLFHRYVGWCEKVLIDMEYEQLRVNTVEQVSGGNRSHRGTKFDKNSVSV